MGVLILQCLVFSEIQAGVEKYCGTDEIFKKSLQEDPKTKQLWEEIKSKDARKQVVAKGGEGPDYVIPVVFHVLHKNGTENISREKVLQSMQNLNEDFRLSHPGVDYITEEFKDVASDTRIEFRLASKDPEGNDFDGINRVESSVTYTADPDEDNPAEVVKWDYDRYLNIYVVRNVSRGGNRLQGYAHFPWMERESDGVVIRYNRIGKSGEDRKQASSVLTHEVGHYLGLFHTFQGGCPDDEDYECSEFGDMVCDTPPQEMPHGRCNTSNTSCGELTNIQNFMDYSRCTQMFTEGQKERMYFMLEETKRKHLHTEENLEKTGTNRPIAAFTAEKDWHCKGYSLDFSELSANVRGDSFNYVWKFEGAENEIHEGANPEVFYNETGSFDVRMTVSNGEKSDTIVKENYVEIQSPQADANAPFSEDFITSFNEHLWEFDQEGWNRTHDSSASRGVSLFLENYQINPYSESFGFRMPAMGMSDFDEPVLSFDHAYARYEIPGNETLKITASSDCGDTWDIVGTFESRELETTDGVVKSRFEPSDRDEWGTKYAPLEGFENEEMVLINFSYYSSKGGNNIHLDNITIKNGMPSAMEAEENFAMQTSIYPNPVNNELTLKVENAEKQEVTMSVTDISGREIAKKSLSLESGNNEFQYESGELGLMDAGYYFVTLESGNSGQVEKLYFNP